MRLFCIPSATDGVETFMEHDWASSADVDNYTNYSASPQVNSDIDGTIKTGQLYFGDAWAEKIVRSVEVGAKTTFALMEATAFFNNDEFTRKVTLTLGEP